MIQEELKRSALLYCTILGIVGAAVTVAVAFGSWGCVAVLAVAAVPCVLCALLCSRTSGQINLRELDAVTHRYAKRSDLYSIVALDQRVFPADDVITVDTFLDWHQGNNHLFCCMFHGTELAGYFSILPLRPETMEAFLDGKIRESDFTKEDILSASAANQAADLYFFSLVMSKRRPRLTLALIQRAAHELEVIRRHGALRRIYASAASRPGKRLLRRLKFQQLQDAEARADNHTLFVKRLDRICDLRDYLQRQQER